MGTLAGAERELLSFDMAQTAIEHAGYRISLEQQGGRHTAWIEDVGRRPLSVGFSFSEKCGTPSYERPEQALAEAKRWIDAGEVKRHPRPGDRPG